MLAFCYVSKTIANRAKEMNQIQLNTRLPKEIKVFLAEQAKKEGRSLNNYLVRHFEELMKKEKRDAEA